MRGDLWQKGGCLVVGVGGNPVYMQYTQVIYIYICMIYMLYTGNPLNLELFISCQTCGSTEFPVEILANWPKGS